jgi:putative hemolysin
MKKMLIMAAACLMAAMTFAAQCAATTKKGTQCKRQASPGSAYCWQHGGSTKADRTAGGEAAPVQTRRTTRGSAAGTVTAPVADGRCHATTKSGEQCKRNAQPGGKYCAQHAAIMGAAEAEAPAAKPTRSAKRKAEAEGTAPAADASAATGMCQGKTKSGEPCKRKAKPGSKFCWQHDK